ncbi:MAG: IS110 family transposase [Candidatus Sumerlaeaceae bacterium]
MELAFESLDVEAPKLSCYFGVDVASQTHYVALRRSDEGPLRDGELRKIKTSAFAHTRQGAQQMLDWMKARLPEGAGMCVVMEATGNYSVQLSLWLRELCPTLKLVVMDPRRIKKYMEGLGLRNKTDKVDARAIACFGAERQPVGDEPVEQIYRDLRAVARARLAVLTHIVALRNQLTSLCSDDMSQAVGRMINKTFQSSIAQLEKQQQKLEQQLEQLVASDERLAADVALLDSVAGVGRLTAITVLGEFGDLRRFRSARQLTAFAGLNPEIKKSGKWIGQSHLSKRGTTYGRRALYMGATSTIKSQSQFSRFYHRLVESSHKHKRAALAAVMRKMLITMRAVVISGKGFDPNHTPKTVEKGCGKNRDYALAA